MAPSTGLQKQQQQQQLNCCSNPNRAIRVRLPLLDQIQHYQHLEIGTVHVPVPQGKAVVLTHRCCPLALLLLVLQLSVWHSSPRWRSHPANRIYVNSHALAAAAACSLPCRSLSKKTQARTPLPTRMPNASLPLLPQPPRLNSSSGSRTCTCHSQQEQQQQLSARPRCRPAMEGRLWWWRCVCVGGGEGCRGV